MYSSFGHTDTFQTTFFLSPECSRAAASHSYSNPSLLTHPTPHQLYAVQPRFDISYVHSISKVCRVGRVMRALDIILSHVRK